MRVCDNCKGEFTSDVIEVYFRDPDKDPSSYRESLIYGTHHDKIKLEFCSWRCTAEWTTSKMLVDT